MLDFLSKFKRRLAMAAAAVLLSPVAFAASPSDVNSCTEALREHQVHVANSERIKVSFRFKTSSGASVQTMTFIMKQDSEKSKVTCKIRRGLVVDIINSDGVSVFGREQTKSPDKDKTSREPLGNN